MTQTISTADADQLIAALTVEEKVALLNGEGMWRTRSLPQHGISSIVMTDGAYGVRYSADQIDGNESGGEDITAFLDVVNQRARDMEAAFGSTRPATCFPTGSCIACSWDVDLAYELGRALALECKSFKVNLLLGPGINIRRIPLAGRSYEYYSEDPVLTGDFAAAVIDGLQDQGVGASLKHFACNNSEIERTTMNSVVDERALREIYLLGFERAIKKSSPWTVMSSYNVLNGVQASENAWLLTSVLREDWGYRGLVVSDWHGIKNRPNSIAAGNDLDMPESGARRRQVLRAIAARTIDETTLDASCRRMMELVDKCSRTPMGDPFDSGKHHALARRMACESIVLLKNRNHSLPLDTATVRRILVVGKGARKPVIQGSGSATTNPTQVDSPYDEILKEAGSSSTVVYVDFDGGHDHGGVASAADILPAAAGADAVIVFANTDDSEDGEGADRKDLSLSAGQDDAIARIATVNSRVIVVLANPDAVLMPWLDEVAAVLDAFYAGQGMGYGVAQILFGRVNPSGKLTVTYPAKLQDLPALLTYPGERGEHRYSDGLYVGYRHFDMRGVEPLFPFGFGLGYSEFVYSELELSHDSLVPGRCLDLKFKIKNVGSRRGKEVSQVYVSWSGSTVHRPLQELKSFSKVDLGVGEILTVKLTIPARDFCFYDVETKSWRLDSGAVCIKVGASSRDIRLSQTIRCELPEPCFRRLRLDSEPKYVLENPHARQLFQEFLARKLQIEPDVAKQMLAYCASSFFGIHTTLNYFFRQDFDAAEVQAVVDAVNGEFR